MRTTVPLTLLLAGAALLHGCGGSDTDPVDKYIGRWGQCEPVPLGTVSNRTTWEIAKADADSATIVFKVEMFGTGDCSGQPNAAAFASTGRFEVIGAKTTQGAAWDEVDLTIGLITRKELFAVSGGRLQSSYPPGAVTGIGGNAQRDPDGYPGTFQVYSMGRL
jgi:hypothetical protein